MLAKTDAALQDIPQTLSRNNLFSCSGLHNRNHYEPCTHPAGSRVSGLRLLVGNNTWTSFMAPLPPPLVHGDASVCHLKWVSSPLTSVYSLVETSACVKWNTILLLQLVISTLQQATGKRESPFSPNPMRFIYIMKQINSTSIPHRLTCTRVHDLTDILGQINEVTQTACAAKGSRFVVVMLVYFVC